MNLLIKSVTIVDPDSPHNGRAMDLLIRDGIVKSIAPSLTSDDAEVLEGKGCCISPGWFDLRVNFRDPGFEYKEDIFSGCKSAIAGGFTGVAVMPSTQPPLHSKSEIEYIRHKSSRLLVDVHPVGTVSHQHEGKELAEMYDMFQSGAVAFSDDKKPLASSGLLMRALLYARNFGGLVMSHPEDKSLSGKNLMNEGIHSTRLGMKGSPAIAEEVMLLRDLRLAEYTGAPIHFSGISCAASVDIIREARAKGIQVSADVTAHHLAFDDSVLESYNSYFKVKPPLRSSADIEALKRGLADGTIDAICSDHSPEDVESKNVEYEYASHGIIGLESAFGVIHSTLRGSLSLEQIISKISINPRRLLHLEVPTLQEGAKANFTVFDPAREWVFTEASIRSKSRNSPFLGHTFTGRAVAVINNGQLSQCEQ
jgi:dihydroorotase